MFKRITAVLIAVVLLLTVPAAFADLQVHFLDVGEADCAIIICDGESMAIDGGNKEDSALIYNYVKKTLGVTEMKAVVATHPHEDHVGGLPGIMNACTVRWLFSPVEHYPDSDRFETLQEYAKVQNLAITVPTAGDVFSLGGASVTFLAGGGEHEDLNDDSLIVRIVYGNAVFLFMADAGIPEESELLESGIDLGADILKVSHHGGADGTTAELIDAVHPSLAVISVGADNDNNHPSETVLDLFEQAGTEVLRTDRYGTVICRSDGNEITVSTLRTPSTDEYTEPYIANINSGIFHRSACYWVSRMLECNKVPFDSANEARTAGYKGCEVCDP